jgi:hypothetical protein
MERVLGGPPRTAECAVSSVIGAISEPNRTLADEKPTKSGAHPKVSAAVRARTT